ncbi:glycosyltransferase [Kineococcus sp. TRM81007]|uniref:glycosyltransferase n=1 Tax=Kineococcus sp. TRM81007 TaxID=2925831 RepID=UPI001F585CD3|nr:glycosyltransferase [Kineococcus sp. TRM81007]MCI2239728.1 glycosyltransferase [Kineococcus sp. TRM81007]
MSTSSVPAPRSGERRERVRAQRGTSALLASTVLTAVGNYTFSLVLIWLLPGAGYSSFATGSSLLLVVGTLASAAVPWVLAQEVASRDPSRVERAARVATTAGVLQGVLVAGVAVVVSAPWASPLLQAVLAATCFATFLSGNVIGSLQGRRCFQRIAALRVLELVSRLAVGAGLALAGLGPTGALLGFTVGSALVVVVGAVAFGAVARPRLPRRSDAALLRRAGGQLAVQGGTAALAGLDVLVAAAVVGTSTRLGAYQAATVLGRVPVFVAVALSMVVFARLVASPAGRHGRVVATGWCQYVRLATPVVLVLATVPGPVLRSLLPPQYGSMGDLLLLTAVGGWLLGAVNLLAANLKAVDAFARAAVPVLAAAVLLVPVVALSVSAGGVRSMAVAVLVVLAAAAAPLLRATAVRWPGAVRLHEVLVWAPAGALLAVLQERTGAWFAAAALVGLAALLAFRASAAPRAGAEPDGTTKEGEHLKILHLGFEDPRRPGAGGGSVRTHEVNARIARTCEVTVVVARYRGCRDYTADGVRYVHVGAPLGYFGSVLAYFAALPATLARHRSDLVVEDFAAPFSSVAVPWMTRRPVVGVVQWLFAREKARQYHLPFHLVENLGLRSHDRLVAVSEDLAGELRRRNPLAQVHAVPNGLPEGAFGTPAAERRAHLLYLGRLECAQKGLDLLLDAYAAVAPAIGSDLLLAGDGPDEQRLRARVAELGLVDRVRFLGRVAHEDRFSLLSSAQVVVMPSRYETFGMVAAEAAAVGTPVLAFDIPCLRQVVTPANGVLVPAFDAQRYAQEIARLSEDPGACAVLGAAGPATVDHLRWDRLARAQLAVYEAAVAGEPVAAGREPEPDTVIAEAVDPAHHGRLTGGVRRTRVLLVGNYGNGNTGDEAICSRLSELLGDTDLTVVSRNPADITALHGVRAVPTVSRASVAAALRSDVVAIGGGGMFGAGLPPLVRALPFAALGARALGKRIAFVALGAYASTPPVTRAALRVAGRLASHVSVRDDESFDTFTRGLLGRRRGVHLVDDPAVALGTTDAAEVQDLLTAAGIDRTRPLLGLSVKPAPRQEDTDRIVDALTAAAQEWIGRHDGEVVCVSLSDQGDYGLGPSHADALLAERIRQRLPAPERMSVVGPGLHPRTAKAVFAACDLVVGVRLHALIFATSTRTPVVGLSFEPKARAWLRATGSLDVAVSPTAAAQVAAAVARHRGEPSRPVLPARRAPVVAEHGGDETAVPPNGSGTLTRDGVR